MELAPYHKVVDLLQRANNPEACFINGFADICRGMPGGAAVLKLAAAEGNAMVSYVVGVLMY